MPKYETLTVGEDLILRVEKRFQHRPDWQFDFRVVQGESGIYELVEYRRFDEQSGRKLPEGMKIKEPPLTPEEAFPPTWFGRLCRNLLHRMHGREIRGMDGKTVAVVEYYGFDDE